MPPHRTTAESNRVDVELVRQQYPIVDVVGRYGFELRRSGAAFIGRCPFHLDRGRPNLTVYPRSGRWVCFRCGASGDVINFVQQLEHLTFLEAVAHLGIAPPMRPIGPTRRLAQSRPESARPLEQSEKDVLAAALDLYRNRLLHESEALAYLARRGFARDIVEQEHLGYCAGDELVPYLVWRGLPVPAARRVGLLIPGGREHLAGRIVFPEIRQGSPVWFIGRSLHESDDSPRYLGLPRSKPLLGWDTASRDLRGVCLVEGPLDLLALRQWGIPGLALCGTRLHPERLAELGRWTRLYAALDADTGGLEATASLVEAFGHRVIPIRLPQDVKDPADLAPRADGDSIFGAAIRDAVARQVTASREASTATPNH
jgi:DNA primase